MFVFDNHKHTKSKRMDYSTIIRNFHGTIVLEIGIEKPKKKRKSRKKSEINTNGIKRELLEYHYGIYRMFPCGKQHQYHMQYIHIKGVCERDIR